MDSSPLRIIVQQAWKPEVIVEESEEDIEAFNNDLPPLLPPPIMNSRISLVKTHAPSPPASIAPQPHPKRRKRRRRRSHSFAKVVKTLKFVKKWAKHKEKTTGDRDKFVNQLRTAVPKVKKQTRRQTFGERRAVQHLEEEEEEVEPSWIRKWLPIKPTHTILYWYVRGFQWSHVYYALPLLFQVAGLGKLLCPLQLLHDHCQGNL